WRRRFCGGCVRGLRGLRRWRRAWSWVLLGDSTFEREAELDARAGAVSGCDGYGAAAGFHAASEIVETVTAADFRDVEALSEVGHDDDERAVFLADAEKGGA